MKQFNAVEFWKWCGFTHEECNVTPDPCTGGHLVSPDGEMHFGIYSFPTFTMDNIFKWAVPKLHSYELSALPTRPAITLMEGGCIHKATIHISLGAKGFTASAQNVEPALALRNAIWNVLKDPKYRQFAQEKKDE